MNQSLVERYLSYVSTVRRYSTLTCERYRDALCRFYDWLSLSEDSTSVCLLPPRDQRVGVMAPRWPRQPDGKTVKLQHIDDRQPDGDETQLLNRQTVRAYEVYLLDNSGESARTVNLHLSILSGFFKYLVKQGVLEANPVRLVPRPKMEKRLPVFFREDSIKDYFASTEYFVSSEFLNILIQTRDKAEYGKMLSRIIVETLYCTGLRRAELIGLNVSSLDLSRKVLHVVGKGSKMREIPLVDSLCGHLSFYLEAVSAVIGDSSSPQMPLMVTYAGGRLYPVFVDRVIKSEMAGVEGATGRKSPHVLRHTIASELLSDGADLNSIKELLGHSSLAATQVYTHSSIERLQSVYNAAHPRAKSDK